MINILQATGAKLYHPYYLAVLADAYAKANQFEIGLRVLNEARDMVDKSEERWWAAELYCLKGELLLKQGATEEEVEQSFQRVIEIARRQQAKSL